MSGMKSTYIAVGVAVAVMAILNNTAPSGPIGGSVYVSSEISRTASDIFASLNTDAIINRAAGGALMGVVLVVAAATIGGLVELFRIVRRRFRQPGAP